MHDLVFTQTQNVLTLAKQYAVPKQTLFDMFTSADNLGKWWGPSQWPATFISFDFKPGGSLHYYMQSVDSGEKMYGKAVIQEVHEPNVLSFEDSFTDADGIVSTEAPKGIITFRFVEENSITTLTMTGRYDTVEAADIIIKMGMVDGMRETWNQLERLVTNRK